MTPSIRIARFSVAILVEIIPLASAQMASDVNITRSSSIRYGAEQVFVHVCYNFRFDRSLDGLSPISYRRPARRENVILLSKVLII